MLVAFVAIAFSALAADRQSVSFPTQDNATIHADAYGRGDSVVVLAHGGRFNRASWADQAKAMAAVGFRVLAIDFRGKTSPVVERRETPRSAVGLTCWVQSTICEKRARRESVL